MKEENPIWVYVTTKDKAEATAIARVLVTESLVACANVFDNLTSIYKWEGKLCEESEAAFLAKTTAARLPEVKARVADLHTYDCPCLISGPIADGLPPFLQWINTQVKQ